MQDEVVSYLPKSPVLVHGKCLSSICWSILAERFEIAFWQTRSLFCYKLEWLHECNQSMFKFNWQMELQKLQMETIKYQKSCPLLKDFVFFFFLIQNLFIDISLGLRHLEHKYKQLPPALSHCAHHWIDRYLLLMMIFIFSDRLMKRSQIQAEQ